jgi:hypothetical protein
LISEFACTTNVKLADDLCMGQCMGRLAYWGSPTIVVATRELGRT